MNKAAKPSERATILEIAASMGSFEAWSIEESRKEADKRRRKQAAQRRGRKWRGRKGSKKP